MAICIDHVFSVDRSYLLKMHCMSKQILTALRVSSRPFISKKYRTVERERYTLYYEFQNEKCEKSY